MVSVLPSPIAPRRFPTPFTNLMHSFWCGRSMLSRFPGPARHRGVRTAADELLDRVEPGVVFLFTFESRAWCGRSGRLLLLVTLDQLLVVFADIVDHFVLVRFESIFCIGFCHMSFIILRTDILCGSTTQALLVDCFISLANILNDICERRERGGWGREPERAVRSERAGA